MKMEYFDVNSAKHLQSDMEALMKSGTGDIGIRCEDKEMRVHSLIVGARYIVKILKIESMCLTTSTFETYPGPQYLRECLKPT